ncbi:hypothetical protein ACRTC3_16460 [Photobacterium damselae]|uniref:hypothetical protein n=1 Tax=Photobacterium damselae TaxID=38293 RepID=UPI003D7DD1CF
MNKLLLLLPLSVAALSGCSATGEDVQASTYDVAQLNQKQNAKTISIIAVTAAKVKVENKEAKQAAQTVAGVVGAIAGAFIGANQDSHAGAAVGGVAGGATGAIAGGLVEEQVLVDGVTLTYSEDDHIYTSTQVGRACQFKPGVALVVSTKTDETRVQPNATCQTTNS